MSFKTDALRNEWSRREADKLEVKRKYPHFDPIVKVDETRKTLVFSREFVAKYSFFPLIQWIKEERRRKLMEDSQVREVCIKPRPILFAAHLDSLIYSWYGFQLNSYYDKFLKSTGLNESVLAYRKLNTSTVGFVKDVVIFIRRKGECAALCFDVSSFFDSIRHDELKKSWLSLVSMANAVEVSRLPEDHFRIFENVTRYKFVEKEIIEGFFSKKGIPSRHGKYLPDSSLVDFLKVKHRESKAAKAGRIFKENEKSIGIPQGLPISGVLANISMMEFDERMLRLAKEYHGLYRRYSDDILLVVDADACEVVASGVQKALKDLHLDLNTKKTEIRTFKFNSRGRLTCRNLNGKESHLQYLGLEFDGVYVYLRSQSIARFYRRLKRSIGIAVWKHIKNGGKILRYRSFYGAFAAPDQKTENGNFISYSMRAHKMLGSLSRIERQINSSSIRAVIKEEVKKRMKNSGLVPKNV